MNDYEKAVKDLAPCGFDCSRCVSFDKGEVVKLSTQLKERLTNYEKLADMMKEQLPFFKYYKEFCDILDFFTKGDCSGCRYSDKPKCHCSINSCVKEHNVNFCAECSKFPCNPKCYNEFAMKSWKDKNTYIKRNGAANFYIEQSKKPRY